MHLNQLCAKTMQKNEDELITQYFNWLREVVGWRLQNMENENYSSLLNKIPLPSNRTNEKSPFLDLIKNFNLNEAEQLVLLLSLAPYYIPMDLNAFTSSIHDTTDIRSLLFLNSSLVNKSNYPSIETAIVLLAGNNIQYRQKYYYLFSNDSKLFKEDIIDTPLPPHGEPFTRANLTPGSAILNNMLTGTSKGPEFSHDFPAMLIESDYNWNDLILDYDTRKQLEEMKEWLDYENLCKEKGITPDKFKPGYKCLFYGPPGTGKTLAASLIGKLTNHKVYRIDLSAVVSKYIGETEKNLSKIFDRAAHGNWILFFDEADALFGKRGATQNAHDRYANQEVSYLLQRFESYEGVSVLASNFKDNIDSAFYRRFHSIVSFKKPDSDERFRLWQVHLPKGFKFSEDINLDEIAQTVKITGAGIYNVMRRSCMKAVLRNDTIIQGNDMLDSVKMEFAKENKMI